MDTVDQILRNIPFLYILLGAAAFAILFAFFVLPFYLLAVVFNEPWRAAAADPGASGDPTGSKGSVGSAATMVIIQAYLPGFGYLAGAYQLVVNQFEGLISSLSAFASVSVVPFLISGVLAAFAAVIMVQGVPLIPGFNEFYACTFLPALNFVLGLANLVDLALGSFWPFVTFWSSMLFNFGVPGLVTRVLLSCTLTLSGNVFATLFADFAAIIMTFFNAIQQFTQESDLLTARMDFIPFAIAIGMDRC